MTRLADRIDWHLAGRFEALKLHYRSAVFLIGKPPVEAASAVAVNPHHS